MDTLPNVAIVDTVRAETPIFCRLIPLCTAEMATPSTPNLIALFIPENITSFG